MSINIQGVVKKFGNFSALKNVSFDVKEGELIALLGPSGSGKTTLLRIIGGLETANAGHISINGINTDGQRIQDRRVGFVFQHYALFRHMSVFDNIAFGLDVRPQKNRPSKNEIRKTVHELLKLIRLENLAKRFPSQLSGGQRQRVALARALAIQPQVLLLDEPFGALDATVRRELRTWLKQVHEKLKMTTLFVTHDQEEALELASRIVIMNEGRIEQIGTPDEVYHHPSTPFVYNFLGSVNLFHCRLDEGQIYLGNTPFSIGERGASASQAKVYIRPHMLEIQKKTKEQSFKAKVKSVHAASAIVRVELVSEWGDLVQVEMPHERHKELQLQKGEDVFVTPKEVKVFHDDYSI